MALQAEGRRDGLESWSGGPGSDSTAALWSFSPQLGYSSASGFSGTWITPLARQG